MKYITLIIGLLVVGCGNSAEKKVVGEYEYKAKGARVEKWVFLDNGIAETYSQGNEEGREGKWSVVDGEIHVKIANMGLIIVWRINKDGSITNIADIDNGKRTDNHQSLQLTLKKIK